MDGKYIVFFMVGLLLGAGLAYTSLRAVMPTQAPQPTEPSVALPAVTPKIKVPEVVDTPPPATSDVKDELKACKATLGKIQGAYSGALEEKKNSEEIIELLEELVQKSGADSPEGRPLEWPTDIELEDTFKPEGFKAALEKLKETCPKQFPPSAEVDCSEFPCAIHQVVDESDGKSWDHKTCPAFKEMFGSGTMTWGSGTDAKEHIMHVIPVPNDARDYLTENEGNARKRSRHRLDEFKRGYLEERHSDACKNGDGNACVKMADAYKGKEEAGDYLRQGCEHGSGSACNNLAWQACHDRGECDDEALENARRATELKPGDGEGAWDTYAYTLCKRGETAASNAAYKSSCDAGYSKNCGKTCQP